ncbi:hypothetical protein QKW60_01545 [Defluviimonas aestuarii]|uniref:CBU_0592 family membrane protein n=1 Tax=Albidovulum aestuarii TaxID=1130726 RepID=UPI00249B7CB9|nr:hypothetical protein [Defluviimonas aestuarii]MDI3335078.1 hypothetical protein [Defluviimonas aestuarii]
MEIEFHDIVGTIGVLLIVGAFSLLQLQRVDSDSAYYSLFNGVGAALILFSLCFEFNLASFMLEFFWLIASVVGIVRRRTKNTPDQPTEMQE